MALQLVPADTAENIFLASAQVKHSGVHIGNGVFLSANHYPSPGGSSSAQLAQGLDTEADRVTTVEYDFTLPDDTSLWPQYGASVDTQTLVRQEYDMALQVAEPMEGAAARMVIFSDPEEMTGNIINVGFPKYNPITGENESKSNRDMFYSVGFLQEGSYSEHSLGGGFIHTVGTGISISDGMSGGGLFLELDPDGDGTAEYFLIGLTTRTNGATAIAPQYEVMASLIESLGRDADDFPRHVLMSGQNFGSSYTTVTGTFFNEDIYGGINSDTLFAGGGDDILTGGGGGDTFIFSSYDGHNVITDFSSPDDSIDVSQVLIPDFAFTQIGADVSVTYDNGDSSIHFKNAALADIRLEFPDYNIIHGTDSEAELFYGTDANDIIYGHGGKDTFYAGQNLGTDIYIGGEGVNHVMYKSSDVGVILDLENNIGYGGAADGDRWFDMQSIQASNHDDTVYGSSKADIVWLHQGNDYFFGEEGDDLVRLTFGTDYVDGGEGYDVVSFKQGNGHTIDVYAIDDARKSADMSTYTSVEEIIAHIYDDVITMGSGTGVEVLKASAGDDILNIMANTGTFSGGSGSDEFHFNPDNLLSSQTFLTVTDFDVSSDSLTILGNAIDLNAPQPLPPGFSCDSDANDDLVIRFGDNDMIIFTDVDAMAFI